ncbi:NUDIX hydrolase [uncultured Deefgea sp.]|uniref:NUDIX hydrolase n=1 Tax=uncultured Deefgea sp. TaxID=1304914 RepID=UPI00262F4887|nr:NUDIX domain-containing protein [uncultured Deefgea sp.]
MAAHIRTKVRCLIKQQGQFLLAEGYDPTKNQHYLMPLGGSVDFGERSEAAIRREVLEEIGHEIQNLRLLQVIENVFTFDGVAGHEIVFVYQAELNAPLLHLRGVESNGVEFNLRWLSREEIRKLAWPVFPEGLLEMLPIV